jgi:hypothetical protein
VAFVVAEAGDLPERVQLHLDAQVDLDLVPTEGLVIYRNERALPRASVTDQEAYANAASDTGLLPVASLPVFDGTALHVAPGGFRGTAGGGALLLASQFDEAWRVRARGREVRPEESFGWGTRFEAPTGRLRVTYANQPVRDVEVAVLAVLWLAALWVTRKPARR